MREPLELKVLSYNIRFGGKGRQQWIGEVLRAAAADVVILQEAVDPEVVEELASLADMPVWTAFRGRSLGLLSRRRQIRWAYHRPRQVKHGFLEVTLASPPLTIFGLHLHPYFSRWTENYRIREARILLDLMAQTVQLNAPHVLLGDFNTVSPGDRVEIRRMPAWIRSLIRISGGRIDTRLIDFVLASGYADAFRRLYPHRPGYTFPARSPHVRLDYGFIPSRQIRMLKDCAVLTSPLGVRRASDHFPLLLTLAWNPASGF
jgi:exodeoxyribonuclease-3